MDKKRKLEKELVVSGSDYDYHRKNARQMTDERLLANMPSPQATGPWSSAMRDEARFRNLPIPG